MPKKPTITSANWTKAFAPDVVKATIRKARETGKTAIFTFNPPIVARLSDNQNPEPTDVYATLTFNPPVVARLSDNQKTVVYATINEAE